MKNKQIIQSGCDVLKDTYGFIEVHFSKPIGKYIGEGIDGGYFACTINFGVISVSASDLKRKKD